MEYKIVDGQLVIEGNTWEGDLYLRDTPITSLPDNLCVGGWLYLRDTPITTLPDNLCVGGRLDLYGTPITSLPDNLCVGGSLDLRGTPITSLPDNLSVGGEVYADFRYTQEVKNLVYPLTFQEGKYILIDGILSDIINRRGNILKTRRVGRKDTEYIITDGNNRWAHGATVQEAREDLVYKIGDRDKSRYENLPLTHVFTFEEAVECYRVITGACAAGVKSFVSQVGKQEKYTIQEMLEVTKGQYGWATFKGFCWG